MHSKPWGSDRSTLLTAALLLLVTAAAWIAVIAQAGSMGGVGVLSWRI